MANKKITLEEKLEESMIKDVPYGLPENWVWTNLECIFQNVTSSTKKLKQKEYEYEYKDGYIEVIDQGESFIGGYTDKKELAYDGKLPVIIFGDHSKCIKFIDFNFVQGADGVKVLLPKKMNEKYLYYMMLNLKLPDKGYSRHYKFLREEPMPIAPLKEQQRIVDRIESLFEKLDKANELIEEARDDFEKRKQSITEKALMGEYVSGVKLTEVELGNILSFKNGMSKRSGKEGNETKVLRLADVSGDVISSENARSMLLTDKEMANYKVEDGELLIIRVNGTKKNVGKAIEYKGENICAYCDHLIRIDCSQVNKTYIKYLINSDSVRRQIDELIVSSAGQNTISQSSLNKIKAMWVENNKGQEKIVGIINTLINKEKIIEELTALEEQIELIKKSILAKAFRGQLGTNCPEEESALELLKEILSKE